MEGITMQLVKSSSLISVGHDPENNVLYATFKNGSYKYPETSVAEYESILNAESPGKKLWELKLNKKYEKI